MSDVLLDTHTVLWFFQDDPKLSGTAKREIERTGGCRWVSVASCWEIAIKAGLGKLRLGEPTATYLRRGLGRNSFQILPISLDHLGLLETLPLHHKDPFDRLLIAQAIVENLPILGADVAFDAYPVRRIW